MASSSDIHGQEGPALAGADPATLKEFVERDALAARRQLEAALAQQPNAVNLWEALVWTFVLTSDMANVIESAHRALARSSSPNLFLWLGVAHLQRGENEQALSALQRSAQLNPTALAADALGRCLHRLGRIDEAIGVLEKPVHNPEAAGNLLFACERGLIYALRDRARWREADVLARDLIDRFKKAPPRVSSAMLHYDMAYPYYRWSDFFTKSGLARRLTDWHAGHPGEAAFWPESFNLPQEQAAFERFRAACPADQVYIVKPPSLYGGRGIRLTRSPAEIGADACVVQRYLDRPYLIDGHKFHVRLYVMVTSAAPLRAYLYREGIVRIAPERYGLSDADLRRPAAHITNTALHVGHPQLKISTDANEENVGHVWSLSAALARMAAEGFALDATWMRLRDLVCRFLGVIDDCGVFAGQAAEHSRYCLPPALFGLDVLIDRDGRPWLLECQRNPAMTGNPLTNRINAGLFAAGFRMSVFGLLDDLDDDTGPLTNDARRSALEEAKEMTIAPGFERVTKPCARAS
jgi:tetratricopeptide (TPR) repeat protein